MQPFFKKRFLFVSIGLCVIWCALIYFFYHRQCSEKDAHTYELALTQTRTLFSQIIDARAWNAAHGGVYVFESEYGKPNMWIPTEQRSLTTNDGRRLVLINPAYMSRQISERTTQRGTSFRITSHEPLRPENAADAWETMALTKCIEGTPEVFSFVPDTNAPHFRYLAALRADKSCIYCHTANKPGDVRGGVSVTLDAKPFLQATQEQTKNIMLAYGFMGLSGVLSIGGGGLLLSRRRTLMDAKERMKSAFLANMSHDMRTPLTGIMGMSEILQTESSPTQQAKALRYLKAASGALLEIINDITDYATLENSPITLEHQVFSLRQSLHECMELFRPQCEAKQLDLTLFVDADIPDLFVGDSFRLRQVLGNLISNATKFTDEGSVEVSVTLDKNSPASKHAPELKLCFAVSDTGIGIDAAEQERIFQRFERGKHMQQQGLPGTGLGLSIAQEIVQYMGGRLCVKSSPFAGACFYFAVCLPQATNSNHTHCEKNVAVVPPATQERNTQEPYTILVAEDNAVTSYYIKNTLEKHNITIYQAKNGAEALAYLKQMTPDAIILDVRMPQMDGFTLTQHIRNGACARPDIPIIVLSASLSSAEHTAFAKLQAQALLIKPVTGQKLLETVYTVIGETPMPAKQSSVPAIPPPAATATTDIATFDIAQALSAMGQDMGLLRHLADIWRNDAPAHYNALEQAIRSNDATEVRRLAHAWKNSAGTLYLLEVNSICKELENAPQQQWEPLFKQLQQAHIRSMSALQILFAQPEA